MAEIRPKKYREVKRALEAHGFAEARQKGSHVVFKKGGRAVTVPNHGGTDIAKGTLRSIAQQAGLSPEELFGDQRSGGRGRDPMELLQEGNPPPGGPRPAAPVAKAAQNNDRSRRRQRSSDHGSSKD